MIHQWLFPSALAAALALLATRLPSPATDSNSAPPSFSKDIAPILQQKCVACHGPEKSKGGFQLHTFEALLKGGESKEPPITPGQPARSKLYQLLIAKDAEDRMPQKDDPLPPAQIALIERWIQTGAKCDATEPKATLASLLPQVIQPDPPANYSRPVPVLTLAFSPDGAELAASGYHEVTFWNPADGTLIRRIKPMAQQTLALVFSPDGTMLAAGGGTPGRAGEVKLINPQRGSILQSLGTLSDLVLALAFSPDGQRLAAGGTDNAIRVYNVATRKEELRIEQHADWVLALAFSPDGRQIASASRDKSVRLFDSRTGDLEETYTGHNQPVAGLAFSRDGQYVFSGGRDKEIHVWQTKDAKKIFTIGGFDAEVIRLSAFGDELFSCTTDNQVRQHRLVEKKAELVHTFSGHRDVVYTVAYHGPTRRVASGSFDGEVRLWDAGSGKLLNAFIAAPGYRVGDSVRFP